MSRLYYRKTDRKAILTLLSVIVAVLSLLHAFGDKFGKQTGITPAADSLQVRTAGVHSGDARGMTDGMRDNDAKGPYYAAESHHPELFFFDPNTADSTTLLQVPGIGRYFARRIMDYGKRLGGYVSVNQLDEIDGFPSEAKQYFTIGDHATQQLDINNLSASELRRHPYITFRQAQALTDYRRMHGPIRDMNALKTLPAFTPDNIERLRPYVKF